MSSFNLKTNQDIEDFLTGVAFFGTGGGGDIKVGRVSLSDCLAKGLEMTALSPEGIEDDQLFCVPCFVGSIAPKTPEVLAEMDFNGYGERKYDFDSMLIEAVRRMEAFEGRKVNGLMVVEMGGSNSACVMAAAYKMGLPVIDGDQAGRAFPEASNSMFSIKGYSGFPMVFLDSWGSSVILTEASHEQAGERIGKYVSQAAYGEMATASALRSGADVKDVMVPNTLSRALAVGAAINRASEGGNDPGQAAAQAVDGKLVCRGTLHSLTPEDAQGYYSGVYCITGTGESAGHEYKIWFKNENHILWVDGVVHTTSPDLISLINYGTGKPLLNTYLENGLDVGVVISKCTDKYKTPEGLAGFSPRSLGFDFDYVPYGSVEL